MSARAKGKQQSRFDSDSVRNSVLIISHIIFRDCRVQIFSDNLSRNSCIAVSLQRHLEISEGLGRGKKSARATMGRGRTSAEQRGIILRVCQGLLDSFL